MMKTAAEVREACRSGRWTGPTCGLAPGYVQANLAVFPKDWAYDFLLFAQRNPKPVPVLEVGDAGDFRISRIAANADVRTDLPKYRIWKNGILEEEVTDISRYWRRKHWLMKGCLCGISKKMSTFRCTELLLCAKEPEKFRILRWLSV